MGFVLGCFEQDLDNGKINQCIVCIIYKDFVVVIQDIKVKYDVWQDGGDYRKVLDCEAGLFVEL